MILIATSYTKGGYMGELGGGHVAANFEQLAGEVPVVDVSLSDLNAALRRPEDAADPFSRVPHVPGVAIGVELEPTNNATCSQEKMDDGTQSSHGTDTTG